MTPAEIEAMPEDLTARTPRLEQILPRLATKADLVALRHEFRLDLDNGLNALGARLDARIDALSRQMLVLHEDVKSHVRLLAEHLARVLERLDGRR